MRISVKGKYALQLLVELAVNDCGKPMSVKDVGRRLNVPDKYMEKIAATLQKACIIKSVRGAKGGYVLYSKSLDLTVGQILRVTEGSLSFADGMWGNEPYGAEIDTGVTGRLCRKLDEAVSGVVDSITLRELVQWHYEIGASQYVI